MDDTNRCWKLVFFAPESPAIHHVLSSKHTNLRLEWTAKLHQPPHTNAGHKKSPNGKAIIGDVQNCMQNLEKGAIPFQPNATYTDTQTLSHREIALNMLNPKRLGPCVVGGASETQNAEAWDADLRLSFMNPQNTIIPLGQTGMTL